MAQLKDLLVAGNSRFVGESSFNDDVVVSGLLTAKGGLKLDSSSTIQSQALTKILGIIPFDSTSEDTTPGQLVWSDMANITIGTAEKLSTSAGGTMQPVYFSGGQPKALPAFKNNTGKGSLGWSDSSKDTMAITSNTLAYWNGAYKGTSTADWVSNIAVVGTIVKGVWQGTPIEVAHGGTGKSSHTLNSILAGAGTNAVTNIVTADGALYATSAGGAAKFGTLPVAQGGTGLKSFTANRLLYTSSATAIGQGYYADGTKMAIGQNTAPTETLYVNGSGGFNGNVYINHTDTGTKAFYIRRDSANTQALKIYLNDAATCFDYTNDEGTSSMIFKMINTDTETNGGANASTATVTFGCESGNVSSVTASKFVGSGASLTNLNASNIASGTLGAARLPTSGVTAGTYGSAQTATHGNSFKIPSVTVDKYGRVTSATTVNVTLPTDTTVTQSLTTTSNFRPLILGYKNSTDSNALASTETNQVYTSTNLYVKPSTGAIYMNRASETGQGIIIQTNGVQAGSFRVNTEGTTSAEGKMYLYVGNAQDGASSTKVAGNSTGHILLYGPGTTYQRLRSVNGAASRTTYLRDHGADAYVVATTTTSAVGNSYTPTYVNGSGVVTACSISDSTSASALATNQKLVTERDVYYGLANVNNARQTSGVNIYAPTTGGTKSYTLVAQGATSTPIWDSTLTVTPGTGVNVNKSLSLDSAVKFVYNSTDKCVDVIFS